MLIYVGVKTGVDIGVKTGVYIGVKTGVDIGVKTGVDIGAKTGVDIGVKTGVDIGAKTGVDMKLVWVLVFSYSCVCGLQKWPVLNEHFAFQGMPLFRMAFIN